MPRVSNSSIRRHKHRALIQRATGFRLKSKNVFRRAKERLLKAGTHAYVDRRRKKRDFRSLWITQINAAARANGLSYSTLTSGLQKAGVSIDRKVLSQIARSDTAAFAKIAEVAKR